MPKPSQEISDLSDLTTLASKAPYFVVCMIILFRFSKGYKLEAGLVPLKVRDLLGQVLEIWGKSAILCFAC